MCTLLMQPLHVSSGPQKVAHSLGPGLSPSQYLYQAWITLHHLRAPSFWCHGAIFLGKFPPRISVKFGGTYVQVSGQGTDYGMSTSDFSSFKEFLEIDLCKLPVPLLTCHISWLLFHLKNSRNWLMQTSRSSLRPHILAGKSVVTILSKMFRSLLY